MPKKNRKQDRAAKIFEETEIESAEAHVESVHSSKINEDVSSDQTVQEEGAEVLEIGEQHSNITSDPDQAEASPSTESEASEEDTSTDDLLNDVRQSLIEDESIQENKKSKTWWRRVAKGLQKDKNVEPEEAPIEEDTTSSPVDTQVELTEEKEETNSDVDEIDDLINMLETEAEANQVTAPSHIEMEVPTEPVAEVDIEELKKQAFQRRESENQENITEVRSVALEDGEEVFVEVQSTPQDPLDERLTALENSLRPYRRYIYLGFTVLGVVMALAAISVLFNIYRQNRPTSPTAVLNLPFPTSIGLPGGLNFSLGRGSLTDGEWNPRGPEWLEGTEVCRWVAIPWSTQLEAVIRTLNADDPIELTMSNNDRLVYKVYSIQQLSNEELQDLPSDSPCLLLVLAKADSETRWVLTALP